MTDDAEDYTGMIDRIGERMAGNIETIFGDVAPSRLYETVDRTDDRVVVSASTIERAGGFGFGAGQGVDSAGNTEGGGGGGGGGWGQARPVALIEITGNGVKVWPVIDFTKLGLVAIGVLAAIWKTRR